MALAFVLIKCASSTHIAYLLIHKESKIPQVFLTRYIFPVLQITILKPNIQCLPLQKSSELQSLV